jgi:hypothetical protein
VLGWKSNSDVSLFELLDGGLGGKFKNVTFLLLLFVIYLLGIEAVANIP